MESRRRVHRSRSMYGVGERDGDVAYDSQDTIQDDRPFCSRHGAP